jgi:hypothetical protein
MAANGNGGESGDYVYSASLVLNQFHLGALAPETFSFCQGDSLPSFNFDQPISLSDYSVQWYYSDVPGILPDSNSLIGWEAIPGANDLTLTPSEFIGTRTYACFVIPGPSEIFPAQWASGYKRITISDISAQSIIGNPNITPFSNFNYIVNPIAGHTYNWTVTNGAIASGQGTNNVTVMWGQNGPYQITLTEGNGTCTDTSELFVVNNNCLNTVSVSSMNSIGFCPGASNNLMAITTASDVTYQWYLNGQAISGAIEQTLEISQAGNYQVMITSGTCNAVSQILTLNQLPSVIVPDISISNSNPGCSGGTVTLSAEGSSFSSYLWSNGATTPSIQVDSSGVYSVELTNSDGCFAEAGPVNVNLSITETPPICLVTVDQTTGFNQVIWEPITSDVISMYAVYKETSATDVYALAGSVAYGQDGIFTDLNSNSAVQSNRYKLAIIDTCQIESSRSDFHRTIHLTSNVGLNNTVNLIWSGYEGFVFSSYNIYRGTDINNLVLLSTVASNINSYTDLAPLGGSAFYIIEVFGISCNPSRSEVSSWSNVITHTTSMINEKNSSTLMIYPNPASDEITLQCDASLIGKEYEVYDIVGKTFLKGMIGSSQNLIGLQVLAEGKYFIKVGSQIFQFSITK